MSDPRDDLAADAGLMPSYVDQTEQTHDMQPATRDALLAGLGLPVDEAGAQAELERRAEAEAGRILPLWQVVEDGPLSLPDLGGTDWVLKLESGDIRPGHGADLGDLPIGIHDLHVAGQTHWLLAAPRRLPPPERGWGVTLPLYGLPSPGGVGSYGDLLRAVVSLGQAGVDFVGINPVHAGFPADPDAFSPYAPSSRRRFSTLHLECGLDLPQDEMVDYAATRQARDAALRTRWSDEGAPPELDDWMAAEGDDLRRFALHQALSELHGPYWGDWPEAVRDVAQAEAEPDIALVDRVRYHAWLQWLAETQLRKVADAAEAVGMAFGLYLDLAVGTHPHGAETWAAPELYARGVSLGAPPDGFSKDGQSWGIAPLSPEELARQGFRPLAAILRAQMRFAKLIRIDHVLGFERAFWVPEDRSIPGGYVAMPREAMLAVARIEAARAGATIIGEDLGNIPDGLQAALEGSGLLGCRVAMFEGDKRAEDYDAQTLTSFSTHDLPTWEGWKAGRDLDWRHDLGSMDDATHESAGKDRTRDVTAFTGRIGGDDVDDMHRFLAETPAHLVAVQIEDVLGHVEQANLPGTVHEHPNWRRKLGVEAGKLGGDAALVRTAKIMAENGR